ncbi:MAG: hypothetical protein KYX62_10910 [Pseudomonadota bacterium]|nr:hypothetical protein [Pseudomonadota bacterium]
MKPGSVSALRLLTLLLTSTLLSACASHQIGPEATFVSPQDQADPPLEVSAAFRGDLCSPQIGYLVFSVRNPQDKWQRLRNVELLYPYAGQEAGAFTVVSGKKLLAWADAQNLKNQRESHNASMARLAALTVSRVMIEDEDTREAGAALGAATVAQSITASLSASATAASKPAGDRSNHILADELIIPPGMDRSFWTLLSATPEAPLMGWITVRYSDERGMPHQFVATLPRWEQCNWQQSRVSFLKKWGQEQGLIERSNTTDGRDAFSSRKLMQLEEEYQAQQQAMASQ